MENNSTDRLKKLFVQHYGNPPEKIIKIKTAGSNRSYFRLIGKGHSVIGTIGEDLLESEAFQYLTDHFHELKIPVPEIVIKSDDGNFYLQEDLGDNALFDLVLKADLSKDISTEIEGLYKKTLENLIRFQLEGSEGLDFNKCYPRHAFDRQSMQWDLNYFKYYFLRPTGINYNEQRLETDFQLLMDYLLEAPSVYFMYRDFQARNIMIRNGEPWFIDYQGGRKGPLQYDLASLLFQAKANLPTAFREKMLQFYLDQLELRIEVDRETFISYYYGFVLLRLLQVLGAYGYRGYFEQKPHFIESTVFAIANLAWFVENITLPVNLPELQHCFGQMLQKSESSKREGLTVEINSFSYKKSGIPKDKSGHGGGFVFDCRALPNPGRYAEYKQLSGKDQPVIDFLQREPAVHDFLEHIYKIIDPAIENYLERGFDYLSINFGCTGGQHRSVYCAENLYKHLKEKYNIHVSLCHKMEPWQD